MMSDNKKQFMDVISYIVNSYYNNPDGKLSIAIIKQATSADRTIIKEVLSLCTRSKVYLINFKISYSDIIRLEEIINRKNSGNEDLFSKVIAIFSFIFAMIIGVFSIYSNGQSGSSLWFVYITCIIILFLIIYFSKNILK